MAKNWAIVIGINEYSYLEKLKFAKTDAEAMHRWLQQSGGFDPQGLFLFTDDSQPIPTDPPITTQPTFGHLDTFFDVQFERQQRTLLKNTDNLWFFFSGHGNRGQGGDYLMLSDSNPRRLEQTALSVSYITERLRNWGAGNVVMFIDACRNVEDRAKGRTITPQDYQGMIAFYSCRDKEKSLEVKSIERGVFTHVLLQALEETKKQNRCLTVAELEAYLMREVPKLSPNQHPLARVEPTYKSNFILFGEAQEENIKSLYNLALKKAFVENKKEEARELLLHANKAAKGGDLDIINALQRLPSFPQVNEPVISSGQPKPEPQNSPGEGQIELKREQGVDYTKLCDLLAAGKWKEADEETVTVILQASDQAKRGYLLPKDIEKLPHQDLHIIDQLWLKYSNGRFGFSIQKGIYKSCGGIREYDKKIWDIFGTRVGWIVNSELKHLEDLTYDLSAPLGHLPAAEFYTPSHLVDGLSQGSVLLSRPDLLSLQVFNFEVVMLNASGQEVKREKGQAQYFTENLGNDITLDMVAIPGGKFLMGTEDREIERLCKIYDVNCYLGFHVRSEKPQHEVTVPPFFMGKYPVTQAQWRAIASLPKIERDLELNPSNFKGDNRPVETVSWEDAVEFCARLSKQTGKKYRLPSEAEWEYACRVGTTTAFHFGETITDKLVHYNASRTYASEPKGEYREQTTTVGSFPPNAFGLYDMHGLVWECCLDDFNKNYEDAPTDGSAWLVGKSSTKVIRGGSWVNFPSDCRSASRLNLTCGNRNLTIGFRVVCVTPRAI